MNRWSIVAVFFAAAAVLSAQGPLPVLGRAMPNAASPGDLVILEGTNLLGVTAVQFTASVGGAAGAQLFDAIPLSVTASRITVLCPTFGAFAPPTAAAPGSPFGGVRVTTGAAFSSTLAFTFYEATFGGYVTVGLGNPQSSGQGRPVVAWPNVLPPTVAPNAPPVPIYVQNAIPSGVAVLALSLATPLPYPFLNGVPLVIDLQTLVLFENVAVDPFGEGVVLIPPISGGPFGLTIGVQWGVIDFAAAAIALSNALLVQV